MNAAAPVVIVAGNGDLPFEAAEALAVRGRAVHLVGIAGEVEERIAAFPHDIIDWTQIGRLFRILESLDARDLILLGGIARRPSVKLQRMDWGAARTMFDLLGVMLAGDNSILSGVIEVFGKRGFRIVSVPELLPELLVKSGANSRVSITKRDEQRIAHGHSVINALGPFDVGQGVVVVGKRVVAVEGLEGTDAMLRRVMTLRDEGRLPQKPGGVLVKCPKPGQDERADLPTIGPETIRNANAAGLLGVGVLAGKTIIVNRNKTLSMADDRGLFIAGIEGAQSND